MISYDVVGKVKTVRQANVSNAADTSLYTAPAYADAMLETGHVCNKSAGAVTFDAWHSSGGTDTYIFKDKSLAAKETLFFPDAGQRFESGAIFKVRAGSATALDVSATFVELTKNTPSA